MDRDNKLENALMRVALLGGVSLLTGIAWGLNWSIMKEGHPGALMMVGIVTTLMLWNWVLAFRWFLLDATAPEPAPPVPGAEE